MRYHHKNCEYDDMTQPYTSPRGTPQETAALPEKEGTPKFLSKLRRIYEATLPVFVVLIPQSLHGTIALNSHLTEELMDTSGTQYRVSLLQSNS